jgi:hypothetical protein
MGITYNKKFTSKKDRKVLTNGPADRQRKQAAAASGNLDPSLVDVLREQISSLQAQLEEKNIQPSKGFYTEDQVNDEIIKAIKAETSDLQAELKVLKSKNKDLNDTIKALQKNHEKEIINLKELIKDKDILIKDLKDNKNSGISEDKLAELISNATKNITISSNNVIDNQEPDRPKMETTFIDPTTNEEKEVEKYFDIEDISISKKEDMHSKVNKLKNLLGKMPSKK